MRLRELHLSALVVIPGWIRVAGGTSQGREQNFHAEDGWELESLGDGWFTVWREGMPAKVTIGDHLFTFVPDASDGPNRLAACMAEPPAKKVKK